MKILCNLTLGPGNTVDFALSVGEDEDGILCVAMLGEMLTTTTSTTGGRCVVGSGYWMIADPHDAEEIAECAKWLQVHYLQMEIGDVPSQEFDSRLIRIADVLWALGEVIDLDELAADIAADIAAEQGLEASHG